MKKQVLCILCILCFTVLARAQNLNPAFQLLPNPKSIKITSENGIKWSDAKGIVAENADIPVLGPMLDRLPNRESDKGISVFLVLQDAVTSSPEGYQLEITDRGIYVIAESDVGLFYGCQTLEQLFSDSRDHDIEIPQMVIHDYPSIAFRAVHLDTKHHLDRLAYYYKIIDKLSHYKINAIIWEVEDKLRFKRRPEIGAPNSISIQEMQAISRYAKDRNIEINPLIQGLGHAGFILKHHWELREDPTSDWEFCPSNPETYELQFDLYRDAMEAMPHGQYIHIGGDEITNIGICSRCKETGKNAFELQMEWLNKVCNFVVENGRTPIVWDDMPLKYADLWMLMFGDLPQEEAIKQWSTDKLDEAISLFPKDCVYMRWNYEDPTTLTHMKVLEWYKEKDLRVMGATGASTGASLILPRKDSYGQWIKDFNRLVLENNLEGIVATSWDDVSPHLETVMRGFIAQADFGWDPNGHSVEEFKKIHAQREFGFTQGELSFLDDLEEAALFFDHALLEDRIWIISLPDKKNLGQWSDKYESKLNAAHEEQARYDRIEKGIGIAKRSVVRNRYTIDIYEQSSFLLHYPVRLLLALEQYDKSQDEVEKQSALVRIKETVDEFQSMRQMLEEVYSQTRFMQAPDGYIADQNHHDHRAARTLNSDWIYQNELKLIEKLQQWLDE